MSCNNCQREKEDRSAMEWTRLEQAIEANKQEAKNSPSRVLREPQGKIHPFEAMLAQQLENMLEHIDSKILTYHQNVLSVCVEMREITRELTIDHKNLVNERLSDPLDPVCQPNLSGPNVDCAKMQFALARARGQAQAQAPAQAQARNIAQGGVASNFEHGNVASATASSSDRKMDEVEQAASSSFTGAGSSGGKLLALKDKTSENGSSDGDPQKRMQFTQSIVARANEKDVEDAEMDDDKKEQRRGSQRQRASRLSINRGRRKDANETMPNRSEDEEETKEQEGGHHKYAHGRRSIMGRQSFGRTSVLSEWEVALHEAQHYNEMMDGELVNLYDDQDDVEHHQSKSWFELFKRNLMGTGFDLVVGVVILANAVVMAIELEYGGTQSAVTLGIPKDTELWPAAEESFVVLNHIFCVIFLLEFFLRVYTLGKSFFKSFSNVLDAAIVWITVVDLYILQPVGIGMPNVSFLRLLRITKLIKALNIIKQLRPFRHLRVLVMACTASTGALFWSIVFLAFIHFMFAILMTQLLQAYLQEESPEDLATQLQVYKYFGTVSRSLLTMWEITLTTGAWAKIGRLLIYDVDRVWTIFFVIYVYLFSFGCMKVISALFLKETLAAANNDQDMMIEEKTKKSNQYLTMARSIFHKIDHDRTDEISIEELSTFMSEPAGMQWFHILEIDANDLVTLFGLLDVDRNGKLNFDQFIAGIMRLRGGARSIDVIELQLAVKECMEMHEKTILELEETKKSVKLLENGTIFPT